MRPRKTLYPEPCGGLILDRIGFMILSCHDSVGPSFRQRGELHHMSLNTYWPLRQFLIKMVKLFDHSLDGKTFLDQSLSLSAEPLAQGRLAGQLEHSIR